MKQGFGVLTEIDVRDTLKKKIGVEFRNYRILGACNPAFAHKALLAEDKIGVLLPCNVTIQEHEGGRVEVAAVDPLVSMQAVGNPGPRGHRRGSAGQAEERHRGSRGVVCFPRRLAPEYSRPMTIGPAGIYFLPRYHQR